MTSKNMLIFPRDIRTYSHDDMKNEERAWKIVEAHKASKNNPIALVVEEVGNEEYILIENFIYYAARLKTQPDIHIPCLVYPGTSDEERLLHILKISIPLEKGTRWLFKNENVMRLKEIHGLQDKEIARKVNCSESVIKHYILDTRIPPKIRDKAIKMEAKTVLDQIASSTVIPPEAKDILYKKAIIEKGNDQRLTGKKFLYMKEFFSAFSVQDWPKEFPFERLIYRFLASNYKIKKHMISLLNSFLEDEGLL